MKAGRGAGAFLRRVRETATAPGRAPDFIVIGAQKAGTTWLHRHLGSHPKVWTPQEKELHYFDEKVRVKATLREKLRGGRVSDRRWRKQFKRQFRNMRREGFTPGKVYWSFNYFFRRPSDEWYRSLFKQGLHFPVVGEATPEYAALEEEGVARVRRVAPEARIVFMVRNPVERAYSQAIMASGFADEPAERVIRRNISGAASRRHSDYLRTLEVWSRFYAPERIFVGFFEDIHFAPEKLLLSLYGFLGIEAPPAIKGDLARKVNSGSQTTMPLPVARQLAKTYLPDLHATEERLGAYAGFWRYAAERLAREETSFEGLRSEELAYPLWETGLWREWTSRTGGAGFASGPLSGFPARRERPGV
ncbi:Sulfotransferase family [Rubrobacter radiotolerans]|uniref:Sulfotransferase n=1 Tax=Rubrobacter radiotolerans TaxID=42256 RepID=A0A023X2F7_RUBRA|nr:sulfotransferase [Rubrobacter radiotolerans]AHY46627.1 Sulfotransferase family [Rubrobacter radiotolerans]MDX5894034.1 sulfotransferase [Rubrobacter radiotolerans]SMC05025.1 Sulfotransferase family protein [Rubrobacter radiotolerans DSM 5868]